MRTEEEIIEEMKKDPHWKLPDPEMDDRIMKKKARKFMAEVRRRIRIQDAIIRKNFEQKNSQIFTALLYLEEERKQLMKHYNQDIHGKENWKSFEKAESISYVRDLLLKFDERLQKDHRNVVDEYNKRIDATLKIKCPKCGGVVFDAGPDGEDESYECMVCGYYFLQGSAQSYLEEF